MPRDLQRRLFEPHTLSSGTVWPTTRSLPRSKGSGWWRRYLADDYQLKAGNDVVHDETPGDVDVPHRFAAALVRGAVQVKHLGGSDEFVGSPRYGRKEVSRCAAGDVFLAGKVLPTPTQPFTAA